MPAQQTTELTAGETLVECAIRESKEETGLMLRNDSSAAGIPGSVWLSCAWVVLNWLGYY